MERRILICDSSCLIDLHKTSLIFNLLKLPYEVVVPQPLFENELQDFSEEFKRKLKAAGLGVLPLSDAQLTTAIVYRTKKIALSFYDSIALAVAKEIENAILFTGDKRLRELAERKELETHGVLWAIAQMHEHGTASKKTLLQALHIFKDENDKSIRLPVRELNALIEKLS